MSIDELADVIGLVSEDDFEENQLEATVHTRSRNIHRPRVWVDEHLHLHRPGLPPKPL